MKRSIRRLLGTCLFASMLTLFHASPPVFAQDSVDRSTPVRTTPTRADEGFHWGWLGALGLIGLLGLSGLNRRPMETMSRTTAVRP